MFVELRGIQASCFAAMEHLEGYKVNELFVLVFSYPCLMGAESEASVK